MIEPLQLERYSRQILLPEFGISGQEKLLKAKVLVVGAGGLGCPVLQYLTAAGIGKIGIADDDVVSLSNLHRQILYRTKDIGKPKAATAARHLWSLNEEVEFEVFDQKITNDNAWNIISGYDVVVDGSDNFPTRYLVNDACVLLNKPLICGSIFRFEGQVAVFNFKGSSNYRDVFPQAPAEGEVPDCAQAGVLGVLPAVIGSLMANEVIKIITGIGAPMVNRLLTYSSLSNTFYEIEVQPNAAHQALIPADRISFESQDYNTSCNAGSLVTEISPEQFRTFITLQTATIVDVREQGEQPLVNEFVYLHKPLSRLKREPLIDAGTDTLVLFCQSGKRSKEAAAIVLAHNPKFTKVYSLKGGIVQWKSRQTERLPG